MKNIIYYAKIFSRTNYEMRGFMSEYIMGLGMSVRICKLYDDLVSFVLADNEFSQEFNKKVLELEILLDDENKVYEKLDENNINKYLDQFSNDSIVELDSVKSRYYNKLKERLSVLDGTNNSDYPFSLETVIIGKLLLDSMKKVENNIVNSLNDGDFSIYDLLYSFHRTYKYTLISMNAFLERLAVEFNFDISNIPNISFERIKENFDCNNRFYYYLDNLLLMIAKDTVKMINTDNNSDDITVIYSNLLSISQLEIITLNLSNNALNELYSYLDITNLSSSVNGRYIKKLVNNKINGDNNGKYIK